MTNTSHRATLVAMAGWEDRQGFKPFVSFDNKSAADRASELLGNAAAIVSLLAAAHLDSQMLTGRGDDSTLDNASGTLSAAALNGVGNLIDLALFAIGGE